MAMLIHSTSVGNADSLRKSLETISGMILYSLRSGPKFVAKSVANGMLCLKAMYKVTINLHWLNKLQVSVWRFSEQSAMVLPKIIIYCVTDQPSIFQYLRSVLNFKFSSHCSEVDELLGIEQSEDWAVSTKHIVLRYTLSSPIHVHSDTMNLQKVLWPKILVHLV